MSVPQSHPEVSFTVEDTVLRRTKARSLPATGLPPTLGPALISGVVFVLVTLWVEFTWPTGGIGFWALARGLFVGLPVAGLIFQSLRSRRLQRDQTRQHLLAVEKLTEITTTISARIDAPQTALDQLATAACDLLEMERAGIALLEPESRTLKIVALAGEFSEKHPIQYTVDELPVCQKVLETREAAFLEDAFHYRGTVNSSALQRFRAGSMIVLPLHVGGRPLGLLFATSMAPQLFNDSKRRLAKLLGSQAAVILSNAELYKRIADALGNQQRLFEHREAIFAVNAAVYQASSLQESMQIIAELAPGVLDVDLCMLTLAHDEDRSIVAAITRPHGADFIGKIFFRKGTNSEIVRATRRMLIVEDAKNHPGTHPVFRDQLDVGSVVYLPLLRTGGQVMGTLVLIRHAAGPFRSEQLNLAEMFTSRAAAAVENAQLLDQTRQDAEAKTMLLRELNHRVKNNLASIITLLSLDEPDLSAKAKQWLNRAIDRIRTMARTHDLFVGGVDRVSIVELVTQMIPSLSVVKPPGVEIRTEMKNVKVLLRTDRAVSLAMVLHELCSNAILHGTGCTGIVKIRASMQSPETIAGSSKKVRQIILEVVDYGRHVKPSLVLAGESASILPSESVTAARSNSSASVATPDLLESFNGNASESRPERVGAGGLGLILVDGLVTRELGGTFSFVQRDDGGSEARVQFPIGDNEAELSTRS